MSQLSEHNEEASQIAPGTITQLNDEFIEVACGKGRVQLTKLQRDGSKPMPANEFINGFSELSNYSDNTSNNTIVFGE